MDQIKSDLKKLGYYQIAGGIAGIGVIIWAVVALSTFAGIVVFLYSLMLLFFAFSIYCGLQCLQLKRAAIKLSLINQYAQLLGFIILGYGFSYVAGVHISVGLDFTNEFKFLLNAGVSNINMEFNGDGKELVVNINAVAIALIVWIDKLQVKAEGDNKQMLDLSTMT